MVDRYVLTVLCDHPRADEDSKPPAAVVTRLVAFDREAGSVAWGELLDRDEHQQRRTAAQQSLFGEIARREAAGEIAALKPPTLTEAMAYYSSLVPDMDPAGRWRFECPECGLTVPALAEKLRPVLDALRANDLPEVYLSKPLDGSARISIEGALGRSA